MDKKMLVVLFMAVGALIGGMCLNNNSLINNTPTNWTFPNEWGNKAEKPKEITPKVPPKEVIPEQKPLEKKQLRTTNYEEALKLSEKHNMPIMILFTADWCHWCEKMKKETFTNPNVKEKLKNYIYCEINTDNDSWVAKKYKVKSLPSCAIINHGKTIKFSPGFKNSTDFFNWLEK